MKLTPDFSFLRMKPFCSPCTKIIDIFTNVDKESKFLVIFMYKSTNGISCVSYNDEKLFEHKKAPFAFGASSIVQT